ncbi:MAG TPA: HAMP domain-containing sensor histidine kinase, partial [bacterium]|nr:HAMP domain-containing sensor histidine kinase [bacterium]
TVVNEVLSYSKSSSITKQELDIREIVESLCNFIKPRCNISNIQLFFQCGDEKILVWGNRESLYNALMNILDNAIRAMPDGGKLNISCMIEDDMVRIEISDTGVGIPEENLEKIFEPFFTTDKKKGTGIGLALTKKIIESHNGNIQVNSKIGAGTTFVIKLPVIKH